MDYILAYWGQERPLCFFVTQDPEEALYLADIIHVLEGPPLYKIKQLGIEIPHAERANQAARLDEYKKCLPACLPPNSLEEGQSPSGELKELMCPHPLGR